MKLIHGGWLVAGISLIIGCGKSVSSAPADNSASNATTTKSAVAANPPTDDQGKFTCYSKANGMCMQFDDMKLGEINDARKSCSETGEKFSMDACPTQGLLGKCVSKAEGDNPAMTTFLYRSDAAPNVNAAKDFCKDMPGVFAQATALK